MILAWLDAENPDSPFPPVEKALLHPSGLLAAGGDLSTSRLLRAYGSGIFPWYEEGQPILWWSPDPRAVLLPERILVSHSLKKTWRQKFYSVSFDTDFQQVVDQCAAPTAGREKTWITPDMKAAYCELHALGHAHSVEVWNGENQLIGGLYGVALGRAFFGESMFSRRPDSSKIALVTLATHLQAWAYVLIDCQIPTTHLLSMGARAMSRRAFVETLSVAVTSTTGCVSSWKVEPGILEIVFGKRR